MRLPTGTIMPYLGGANSKPPAGWLYCDGAVISQSKYAKLYAVVGITYNTGGEGAGNFRLPAQRYLMSQGTSGIGGSGYFNPSNFANHTHNASINLSGNLTGGSHVHSYNIGNAFNSSSQGRHNSFQVSGASDTNFDNSQSANNYNLYISGSNHVHIIDAQYNHAEHGHNINARNENVPSPETRTHSHSYGAFTAVYSTNVPNEIAPPFIEVWHIIKI